MSLSFSTGNRSPAARGSGQAQFLPSSPAYQKRMRRAMATALAVFLGCVAIGAIIGATHSAAVAGLVAGVVTGYFAGGWILSSGAIEHSVPPSWLKRPLKMGHWTRDRRPNCVSTGASGAPTA